MTTATRSILTRSSALVAATLVLAGCGGEAVPEEESAADTASSEQTTGGADGSASDGGGASASDGRGSASDGGGGVQDPADEDDDHRDDSGAPEDGELPLGVAVTGILPDGEVETTGDRWEMEADAVEAALGKQLGDGADVTCSETLAWGGGPVTCEVVPGEVTWYAFPVSAPVGYEPEGAPSIVFVQETAEGTAPLDQDTAGLIQNPVNAVTAYEMSEGYEDQDRDAELLAADVTEAVSSTEAKPGVDRSVTDISCEEGYSTKDWESVECTGTEADGNPVEIEVLPVQFASGSGGPLIILTDFH